MIMPTALKEMESLIRSWHEGGYTNDEFCAQLDRLILRHGAKIEITKSFANGLNRYAVKDKAGEIIGEYTGK